MKVLLILPASLFNRWARISAAGFATVVLVFSLVGCGEGDQERVLTSIKSPDLNWIVEVKEHTHSGAVSTAESYALDIVQIRKQADSEGAALIFSMDSDGDASHHPVVTWLTNEKLSISVVKGSSIEHWSTRFRGIEVGVHFR